MSQKYSLKSEEIKKALKEGKFVYGRFCNLKILKNTIGKIRFAIIVSKKLDKRSVARNKIKRRIKEIIRLNLVQIQKGFDLVVLTKKEIIDKTYQEIQSDFLALLKNIKE